MNISHSLTVQNTNETFVTSYHNGHSQSCTFVDDGESLSICFDRNCLSKLSETIDKLQEVYQILVEEKQREIAKEFQRLSLPNLSLPVYLSDSRNGESKEITF